MAQKIRFRLSTDFKPNLQETPILGESFSKVSRRVSLFHKNSFVFMNQIWHYKALNQYSIAQNIRFRLLTDFKTNLQKTTIHEESFWKVSRFASLFQKNGFVFVNQIWHHKALNQYSMVRRIRFRFLTDFKTNLLETSI